MPSPADWFQVNAANVVEKMWDFIRKRHFRPSEVRQKGRADVHGQSVLP